MCFQGNIGNADTHYLQFNDTNLWSEFPPQLYRITYPEKAKVFFKTCLKFFFTECILQITKCLLRVENMGVQSDK